MQSRHRQLCHMMFLQVSIVFFTFSSASRTPEFRTSQYVDFKEVLSKLFNSDELSMCTVQLITYTKNEFWHGSHVWTERLGLIAETTHNSPEINGVVVSEITTDLMGKQYRQPERITHTKRCNLVILVMNILGFPLNADKATKLALLNPVLRPQTIRNRDKYLILSNENSALQLKASMFIKSLKYKLVAVLIHLPTENILFDTLFSDHQILLKVTIKHVCQYGLCKRKLPNLKKFDSNLIDTSKFPSSVIALLFPDHERNFYGHSLRLSVTTKVPQLLELVNVKSGIGKYFLRPRRGLYASVLVELSERLNFTYTIIPSSGNGSTGHALSNGTWVGTVGDTFKGLVDFGFMAAITFQRFPYAEFCAPINFAYLGFVTGPARKSYAWNAILWPFSPVMWIALFLTMLIASKLLLVLLQSSISEIHVSVARRRIKWTYLKGISYLARGLLEQCPDMPKHTMHTSFRIFLTFWLVFALVCGTAYRSKMVSLLTFPLHDHIPTNFNELALAKDFLIDFHYFGNVGYTYFKTSTNPSFVKIFNRMGREPSPLKCLQRTIDQKAACIIFIVTFEELLHRNLSDQYGGSPLKFTRHEGAMFPAGVIHEYQAPLSSNFKRLLFPALETGLIPFWQQSDLNEVLKNKNQWQKSNNIDINDLIWGNNSDDSLLRVRNLQGAFVILALGIATAILAWTVENTKRCGNCNTIFPLLRRINKM